MGGVVFFNKAGRPLDGGPALKKLILPIACVIVIGSAPARAQISLHIDIGLPAAPPLVQVQPGVQVVEGFHDEVFFNAGWYWCRRQDGWYRARSPRARFDWVDAHQVPHDLVRMPPGHYRNWHHDQEHPGEHHGHGPSDDHGHGHGHEKHGQD